MIVRKSKYSRGQRLSNRNSFRRNTHQRNGGYGANVSNKTKIKGNPTQILNKYLILAREALSSGDRIQAEYYFQHADHYSRIMIESGMEVGFDKNEKNQKNDQENLKEKNESLEKLSEGQSSNETLNDENDISLDSVAFLSGDLTKK